MVFVCTAMGVLYVEHANVLELCYIELLSGDGSPYSILSAPSINCTGQSASCIVDLKNCKILWDKRAHSLIWKT